MSADQLVPLLLSVQQQQSPILVARLLTDEAAAPIALQHLRKQHAAALPALHAVLADQEVIPAARLRAFDLILEITEQAERQSGLGDIAVVHNAHRLPDKYDRLTISLRDHPTLMQQLQARVADDESDRSVRFAVAKLFAWQGLVEGVPALISFATSENTATNAAVWQALARYTNEIDRRQLTDQQQALPTLLQPLAGLATDIIALPHDEELVRLANERNVSSQQRDPARASLSALAALQGAALRLAAAMQTESTAIADQALQWAMRESWPKNPRNYQSLAVYPDNYLLRGRRQRCSNTLGKLTKRSPAPVC